MDYLVDSHCHTSACAHAYSTIAENAETAYARRLQAIAITEHAPSMPGAPHIYFFDNLRSLPNIIDGVRIFKGAELNIIDTDGTVDLPDSLCQNLDVTIASLHPPCFEPDTKEENTKAVINAVKKPFVKILGHPTDNRYPMDYRAVVETCKQYNTAIEINNSSFSPTSFRAGGESIMWELFDLCKEFEVPMVMGSDAHFHEDVGNFSFIKDMIEKSNISEHLIANISIENYMKIFKIQPL